MRNLVAVLLLFALPALAEENEMAKKRTVLSMTETSDRAVPQDRLTVYLLATVLEETADAAQTKLNEMIGKALPLARQHRSDELQVSTGGYNVHEEFEYEPTATGVNQRVSKGFRASQMIILRGTDTDGVSELATELQQTGLRINGMNFDLAPATKKQVTDELAVEVLHRIQQRAEVMAEALAMRVDYIARVTTTPQNEPRIGRGAGFEMAAAAAPASAKGGAPVDVEAGEQTVSVTFGAEVYLK